MRLLISKIQGISIALNEMLAICEALAEELDFFPLKGIWQSALGEAIGDFRQ